MGNFKYDFDFTTNSMRLVSKGLEIVFIEIAMFLPYTISMKKFLTILNKEKICPFKKGKNCHFQNHTTFL